jgi:hypothetical protein
MVAPTMGDTVAQITSRNQEQFQLVTNAFIGLRPVELEKRFGARGKSSAIAFLVGLWQPIVIKGTGAFCLYPFVVDYGEITTPGPQIKMQHCHASLHTQFPVLTA